MSYRLPSTCLWIVAVLSALALADRVTAKPPDLPINPDHTVTPDFLPDSDWESPLLPQSEQAEPQKPTVAPVGWPFEESENKGQTDWLEKLWHEMEQEPIYFFLNIASDNYFGHGFRDGEGAIQYCVKLPVVEPPVEAIYLVEGDKVRRAMHVEPAESLDNPNSIPPNCFAGSLQSLGYKFNDGSEDSFALPAMGRLSSTQRQNLASTLLFGIHPLLVLVPTEDLVDLPCDHPGRVVSYPIQDRIVEGPNGEILHAIGIDQNETPLFQMYEGDDDEGNFFGAAREALKQWLPPMPLDLAGWVIPGVMTLPPPVRPVPLPRMPQLSATQRQHYASTVLFGIHPLLALIPTEQLVDMPCDHPPVVVQRVTESNVTGVFVPGSGVNSCAGLNGAIVPVQPGVHGTIEIGIGFSLQEGPIYKLEVTEFQPNGTERKEQGLNACVEALKRAFATETLPMPHQAEGGCEESSIPPMVQLNERNCDLSHQHCPYSPEAKEQPNCIGGCGDMWPSVLENLERLLQAQQLSEKGRRFAEDGFPVAALKCYAEAKKLCPGSSEEQQIDELIVATIAAELGNASIHAELAGETEDHCCVPGVDVMVDGLLKACHQAVDAGRCEHAVDLARQAFALDPQRVKGDILVYKLYLLSSKHRKAAADKVPVTKLIIIQPLLPAIDPQTVRDLEELIRAAEAEEQEEPTLPKATAKPYCATTDAKVGVAK